MRFSLTEIAIQHGIQSSLDFVGTHVSEEAQPATVDAEHRNLVCDCTSCGIQHRPIAADGDNQIGFSREFCSRLLLQNWPGPAAGCRPDISV